MKKAAQKAALLMILGGAIPMVQADEANFSKLAHHRSLDEGRDWHNMPFPYETDVKQAKDFVGKAHLTLPGPQTNKAWAPGWQFSGIRLQLQGGWLLAKTYIETPLGSASLSFRIYPTNSAKGSGSIIGNKEGIQCGAIDANEHIGLSMNGKMVIKSASKITDGRSEYDTAHMTVIDECYPSKLAVDQYTYFGALPAPTEGFGKKSEFRVPLAVRTKGKKHDLIVQANSRLWYYVNESKKGKLLFSEPQELTTTDAKTLETDGAALLEDSKLIIRRTDGILVYAEVVGEDIPQIKLGDTVKNAAAADFKCPSRFFVVADYDKDKKPDFIVGLTDGLYYYANTGNKNAPAFSTEPQLIWRGTYNVAPGLGDINGDGLVDLLHGINRGTMSYWLNSRNGDTMIAGSTKKNIQLNNPPDNKFMRHLNGSHLTVEDFDGDGTPDLIIGGQEGGYLVSARGTAPHVAQGQHEPH